MKATKVLGIVLGALLVAALFTGAAAAADQSGDNLGTLFYYEKITLEEGDDLIADWYNLDGQKLSLKEGENVIDDTSLVAGTYYRGGNTDKDYVVLAAADAAIKGFLTNAEGAEYTKISTFIDGVIGTGKFVAFDWDVNTGDRTLVKELRFSNPAGTLVHNELLGGVHYVDNTNAFKLSDKVTSGLWTVQAYFDSAKFADYTPESYLYGSEYHFTVAKTSLVVTASTTEVIKGNYVTLKLEGVPGDKYFVDISGGIDPYFTKAPGCPTVFTNQVLTIGNDGTVSIDLIALRKGTANINIYKGTDKTGDLKKELEIVIKAGAVTVKASAESVFIGNKVTFSGTNDNDDKPIYLWIKGTNLPAELITGIDLGSGKEWEIEDVVLKFYNDGSLLDAGSYTIYASTNNEVAPTSEDFDSDVDDFAAISLVLKQPFITVTKAPEVIVQGDDIEIIATTEGKPSNIQYYVFGTNFFKEGMESPANGKVTITVETSDKEENANYAATGQYFFVLQHPMYDDRLNILPFDTVVVLNEKDQPTEVTDGTTLFNVDKRQTANAAEALCRALDSQNIDDMYVKGSFIVAVPTSVIDAIPTQITKGQVLTVSGTTTGHSGDMVVVELLSTAFAAVPKEAVGSAAFTSLSTKIGDDGVWSISFDTSNLNADEYTCSVAVGQLGATSSKITIVEGSTPVNPTQTTGPVTPTAQPTAQPTQTPATPGFGALAALAGLGAVAVLLLRRQ